MGFVQISIALVPHLAVIEETAAAMYNHVIAKLALVVLIVQLISKVINLIFHSCSYPRFLQIRHCLCTGGHINICQGPS